MTPFLNWFNTKKHEDTIIQYDDFNYTNSFIGSGSYTNKYTMKESFTDRTTEHIRENEQTLTIEPIEEIIEIAQRSGFISKSKANMKSYNRDENQYLVVFERLG